MKEQNFDVNKLRVASPCSSGWDTMNGDNKVRFCDLCSLNVYNFSEMTSTEIQSLITGTENRICAKIYKRADGTVITRDCPVGLRAYYKRTARFASAALATILGLFSVSFGQKNEKPTDETTPKIVRTNSQENILGGQILDQAGAIIPGAEIKLYKNGDKKPLKTNSNKDGDYIFHSLLTGIYSLEVKVPNFKKFKVPNIRVNDNEKITFDIILLMDGKGVTVGVIAEEPLIDMSSSTVTHRITRQVLDRIQR